MGQGRGGPSAATAYRETGPTDAGAVDIFGRVATNYHPLARVETSSGARTSLFVPELDRLYVAARAGLLGSDAAILVFRPLP